MNFIKNNKGLTLTETVASMAIMSLITLTLLMVLSMSYINTFNLKEKNEITYTLNETSENIYSRDMKKQDVLTYLKSKGGHRVKDITDLSIQENIVNPFNFYVTETTEFVKESGQFKQKVILHYFYENNVNNIGTGVEYEIFIPNLDSSEGV